MKLICINTGSYFLTIGKIYDVIEKSDIDLFSWYIFNDKGYKHLVEGYLFRDLLEVRDEKINFILNE